MSPDSGRSRRSTTSDSRQDEWSYKRYGNVGVWNTEGWQGDVDETFEAVSDHYRETTREHTITATLVVFGGETALSKETQERMGEEWSRTGRHAGIEKIGFVSEGLAALAVKAILDVPGAEIETFDTLEAGLDWARK